MVPFRREIAKDAISLEHIHYNKHSLGKPGASLEIPIPTKTKNQPYWIVSKYYIFIYWWILCVGMILTTPSGAQNHLPYSRLGQSKKPVAAFWLLRRTGCFS